MNVPIIVSIVLMAALIGSTGSFAQSGPAFDCAKAEREIEQLVCQDETLAAKDLKLASVYRSAIAAIEKAGAGAAEAIKALRATQRGWISGWNDCWKADDKRQCALERYEQRTAYLQARYFLIDGGAPVLYTCNSSPADEIVATFIATDPPSVRLERGDSLTVGILSPSSSGSRYEAEFGVYFWVDGGRAQVAWPQDQTFNCTVRR
jgi:uncharacterized protein